MCPPVKSVGKVCTRQFRKLLQKTWRGQSEGSVATALEEDLILST